MIDYTLESQQQAIGDFFVIDFDSNNNTKAIS
jgi:hypothetical protein